MKRIRSAAAYGALIAALLLTTPGVHAQEHRDFHGPERAEHLDGRYSHNHFYVNHGGFVHVVPGRPYIVGGGRFYYSGGVWYAPRGGGFVVVGAPVGFFVPVLPPFYTTVWFGGVPYYYANDTYYMWSADQNGYEVVAPPGDPAAASTEPPPQSGGPPEAAAAGADLYIYPQNGQSADTQANDKYECHKWSVSQSGFDPTQSGGGVSPDQAAAKRGDYQRAMRACLEGRGYSVR
jgi:Family of unknown function (DUF6515)